MIRITVAVENTVLRQGLLAEHGLAYYIETDDVRILFDTGQGLALGHNINELGILFSTLEVIALSHGHYDHTGGLATALPNAPQAVLIAHPDAFTEKYRPQEDGDIKDVGMPEPARQAVKMHPGRISRTKDAQTIAPGIHLTGEIPFRCPFEPTVTGFFQDQELTIPDPLYDDRALWLETERGLIILLGCAHRGVINTLSAITEEAGTTQIYAVLGGMHLAAAGEQRINQTVQALFNQYQIKYLYPGHCTGHAAQIALYNKFGTACRPFFTGLVIN